MGSLKFLHTSFDKYLNHMLMKSNGQKCTKFWVTRLKVPRSMADLISLIENLPYSLNSWKEYFCITLDFKVLDVIQNPPCDIRKKIFLKSDSLTGDFFSTIKANTVNKCLLRKIVFILIGNKLNSLTESPTFSPF